MQEAFAISRSHIWLVAVVAIAFVDASIASADKLPNFVIIMADDMGYGDASCYGKWAPVKTPQLDRMAKQGLRFTDFHSSGNVCSPTRAGLLTGRYQQRAGIPGVVNADPKVAAHWHALQHNEVTFAEALKEKGYATGIFGKWHVGYEPKYNPVTQGFDEFIGFVSGNIDFHSNLDRMNVFDWWHGKKLTREKGYSTHLITQHAVRFIEQNKSKPFCVYVAHEAVHSPWQGPNDPPQRFNDTYPRPANLKRAKVEKNRAWKEMMVEMDKGVGQVLDHIDALGLADNTLVMFFSDNGPAGGSAGPLRGRKGSDWEGGHRVPCIAWWPGKIKPGGVTDQLSITLDVMPTLLDLAGVKPSRDRPFDGVSLKPLLLRGESLGKRQLFWNGKAMRDGDWKLMIDGKGAPRGQVGLYNLAEDIGERNNLAAKHPDRVKAMREALEAWKKDVATGTTQQPPPPQLEDNSAPGGKTKKKRFKN